MLRMRSTSIAASIAPMLRKKDPKALADLVAKIAEERACDSRDISFEIFDDQTGRERERFEKAIARQAAGADLSDVQLAKELSWISWARCFWSYVGNRNLRDPRRCARVKFQARRRAAPNRNPCA
jgi:hypothetical protein